ncbi:hypothetical protein AB0368_34820 [Actinoplanes sp. NPDC051475]|uniref:hypothetical protein n=1 Tax=Actinoplanes sp. NPDC051475 TaxID=3157225 RepID=UPI00344B1665
MSVIDLDRAPAVPSKPARRHVATVLAAVVIFVAGGAGTSVWGQWQTNKARSSEVSVLVLANTGPQANDAGVGGVVAGGKVVDASLTRRVTLVNAGPLPVDVHGLRFARAGLTVRAADGRRWIRHGQAVQADADIRVICARGLPIGRLPMELAVRTSDDRERTATAVLDAREWNEQARVACAGDLL